jgi:hypothetical protein
MNLRFHPVIEGTYGIRSSAPEFLERMKQRVGVGLLSGQPHRRSNYVITHDGPTHLHIHAADWWTALNVGLNEFDLQAPEPGLVGYRVRYWRWASYVLGLSAVLGVIGVALLLLTDVRSYISEHQAQMIPGLTVEQNLLVAWGMAVFWGFIWPWLLIRLHQRPVRRLVERLISEVDGGGAPAP